jgi:hypothetical protein
MFRDPFDPADLTKKKLQQNTYRENLLRDMTKAAEIKKYMTTDESYTANRKPFKKPSQEVRQIIYLPGLTKDLRFSPYPQKLLTETGT